MNETLMNLFRELTEAPGAPGHEAAAREVMRKHIEPYADEILHDRLGSLIAKKTGDENGPRIVFAGHLDEVAFMVTQITKEGFLKFQPLGGWWAQVMLAQRVQVQTRHGLVDGVVGSVPPHLMTPEARRKMVEIKDMFIDVGAASKEEAESFGIRPGDPIIPVCPFTPLKNPKVLMAKAWDNRLGCAAVIELMKRLKDVDHPNVVYAVGTVMEEVGTRGGHTVGHMLKPDIAIAVDVGLANDTPGIQGVQAPSKMGGGPELTLYDARMIAHPGLRDWIISVAEEEQIPLQFATIPGGSTDASAMHLIEAGVPAVSLSVPTRYIHSHASLMHLDDFERLVNLLVAIVKRLDRAQVESLRTFS